MQKTNLLLYLKYIVFYELINSPTPDFTKEQIFLLSFM